MQIFFYCIIQTISNESLIFDLATQRNNTEETRTVALVLLVFTLSSRLRSNNRISFHYIKHLRWPIIEQSH